MTALDTAGRDALVPHVLADFSLVCEVSRRPRSGVSDAHGGVKRPYDGKDRVRCAAALDLPLL